MPSCEAHSYLIIWAVKWPMVLGCEVTELWSDLLPIQMVYVHDYDQLTYLTVTSDDHGVIGTVGYTYVEHHESSLHKCVRHG